MLKVLLVVKNQKNHPTSASALKSLLLSFNSLLNFTVSVQSHGSQHRTVLDTAGSCFLSDKNKAINLCR